MDGNNRWSKLNSQTKLKSYTNGAEKILKITEFIFNNYEEVKYISAFALSNNNLNRSKIIINTLKKVFQNFLDQIDRLDNYPFNITFKGDLSFLDKKILNKINKIKPLDKRKKNLIIFVNYSGRKDIEMSYKKKLKDKISFNNFKIIKHLSTKDLPDPDILIRTGGFRRISDFLLYQLAFTELYFLNVLWPNISNNNVRNVINSYMKTSRKFGL